MQCDPQATQRIRWESFCIILRRLPDPIGLGCDDVRDYPMMLRLLNIPLSPDGMVRYNDCVSALAMFLHGIDMTATNFLRQFVKQAPPFDEAGVKVFHAFAVR